MNRRTLLGMVLGALAGVSLPKVAWAAVERNLTPVPRPDPSGRLAALRRRRFSTGCNPQIAELFVSCGADVSAAIAGLTARGDEINHLAGRFEKAAPPARLLSGAEVGIASYGSLIIRNEAEGKKFIQDMANAVAAAAKRRRDDGTFSF